PLGGRHAGRQAEAPVGRQAGEQRLLERHLGGGAPGRPVEHADRRYSDTASALPRSRAAAPAPRTATGPAAARTAPFPRPPDAAAITSETTAVAVAPPPAPGPRTSTSPSGSAVNSAAFVGPCTTSGCRSGSDSGRTATRQPS